MRCIAGARWLVFAKKNPSPHFGEEMEKKRGETWIRTTCLPLCIAQLRSLFAAWLSVYQVAILPFPFALLGIATSQKRYRANFVPMCRSMQYIGSFLDVEQVKKQLLAYQKNPDGCISVIFSVVSASKFVHLRLQQLTSCMLGDSILRRPLLSVKADGYREFLLDCPVRPSVRDVLRV